MGRSIHFYLNDLNYERIKDLPNRSDIVNSLLNAHFGNSLTTEELKRREIKIKEEMKRLEKSLEEIQKELKKVKTIKLGIKIGHSY